MYTLARSSSGVVLLAIVVAVLPVAVQAASTTVSIRIPPTQVLEGATQLVISPAVTVHSGSLTVKSNISWILMARVEGQADLTWRAAGSAAWQPLRDGTLLSRGAKGVHTILYEVRRNPATASAGQSTHVSFSLVAAE